MSARRTRSPWRPGSGACATRTGRSGRTPGHPPRRPPTRSPAAAGPRGCRAPARRVHGRRVRYVIGCRARPGERACDGTARPVRAGHPRWTDEVHGPVRGVRAAGGPPACRPRHTSGPLPGVNGPAARPGATAAGRVPDASGRGRHGLPARVRTRRTSPRPTTTSGPCAHEVSHVQRVLHSRPGGSRPQRRGLLRRLRRQVHPGGARRRRGRGRRRVRQGEGGPRVRRRAQRR